MRTLAGASLGGDADGGGSADDGGGPGQSKCGGPVQGAIGKLNDQPVALAKAAFGVFVELDHVARPEAGRKPPHRFRNIAHGDEPGKGPFILPKLSGLA